MIVNHIYGLGGRDIFESDMEYIFRQLIDIAKKGKVKEKISFIGVRE